MRHGVLLPLVLVSLIIFSQFVMVDNSNTLTRYAQPFVTVYNGKFYLNGEEFVPKGVNYYPRDYGWNLMWDHLYEIEDVIDADMARAKSLGVNVVRIIIQYSAFGGGNATRVQQNLSKLDTLLSIIDKYNMKAIVTLLDWENPEDNLDEQLTHVRTIVSAFKDDPRIFAWDVRNEPDHFYYSNSWKPYVRKPDMMNYLHAIIQEVKADDPNHLVAVGEYGWYLGDRSTTNALVVNDNFDDGNYDGWTVKSGTWQVSSGALEGTNGIIVISDNSWWGNSGYAITVRMRTSTPGSQIWNVGRIIYRYVNESNYYAVLLKTNGELELAKMQNGAWISYLAVNNTGLNPEDWHTYRIVTFRNETEVYVDGTKYLYFWDDNPINSSGSIYGGIALQAEGGSTALFDDALVEVGPNIITEDEVFKDADFVMFHWYGSTDVLDDALSKLMNFTDKPVLIEEMGRPTNGTNCPYNESSVASWLQDNLNVIKNYGSVYPMIWVLNDFTPQGTPGLSDPNDPEHYFGLYRTDYSLKPSGAVFRDDFAGTQLINDASFVSANHPQEMNVGETAQVELTFHNSGDTYWDSSRSYRLGSQEPRDNQIWGTGRVDIENGTTVYPGDNYTFRFNITAPQVPGKYSFSWRMLREHVQWFGDTYYGSIRVDDPSLSTVMYDEFSTMDNWTVLSGSAEALGGYAHVQSGMVVYRNTVSGDVRFSYRAYSVNSGDNQSLMFVRALNSNNYLGFRLLFNGTAEIFYRLSGGQSSDVIIARKATLYTPGVIHTFYVEIVSGRMSVYIDGEEVFADVDISAYPYYSSGYVGFLSPHDAYVDQSSMYDSAVPEFSWGALPLLVLLVAVIIAAGGKR